MQPIKVDDVTLAFPALIDDLMPDQSLHVGYNSPLGRLAADIFGDGSHLYGFCAREGIDAETAWRHVAAILRSYAPKHQHKIGGVGYLLGEWFDTVIKYDDADKDPEKSTVVWEREPSDEG